MLHVRPRFLITFVLVCVAVMATDRYLTTDAVKLCMAGNNANNVVLATIITTQQKQEAITEAFQVAVANAAEMRKLSQINDRLAQMLTRLMAENAAMRAQLQLSDPFVQPPAHKGPVPAPSPPSQDKST